MNTVSKFAILIFVCVAGGFAGGLLGMAFYVHHISNNQTKVLRTQRVEVLDEHGRTRGIIGSDKESVFFRLVAPDGQPEVTASVPNETQRIKIDGRGNEPDGTNTILPGIVVANEAKNGEVRIEVGRDGNGRVALGTDPNWERVTLGHFSIGDLQPDPLHYGGWGLQVLGRGKNGVHLATGLGISTQNGVDDSYLSPVAK